MTGADFSEWSANVPWLVRTHDEAIAKQAVSISDHDRKNAVQDERLDQHAASIGALTALMNKVIWALVGLSLTIAASAAAVALTVGSGGTP